MKQVCPRRYKLFPALAVALLGASGAAGLTPTEWEHRQVLMVPAMGLVQVDLPEATFDAASSTLADVRVLDSTGKEISLLLDHPAAPAARTVVPADTAVSIESGATALTLTTGTTEKLRSLHLLTPTPFFLRAAKVEISPDRAHWTVLQEGAPLFRQWGAEQLRLDLGDQPAAYIRVTVSDRRDQPLAITGATLNIAAGNAPENIPIESQILRREEFAGETVLTLELAAKHLPLEEVRFNIGDPLFMRRVELAVREVQDAATRELPIAAGTIYRVALEGGVPQQSLTLPVFHIPDTRELLVHIYNGDSPPLDVSGVQLRRLPLNLFFFAPTAGSYQLLTGNPQAAEPHYDLAGFSSELRGAKATRVVPGPLENMPGYQPANSLATAPLPDVPLAGAPLDTRSWTQRRAVKIAAPGIQELELDLAALAGSRPDYADLRLIANGAQIPYILELPALARSISLVPQGTPDPQRRSLSIWKLALPRAGLPLQNLTLRTTSPLFQRHFRIYEKVRSGDAADYEDTLTEGDWSRTPQPGALEYRSFSLGRTVRSNAIWLEADNGDNPPIALTGVQVTYPVVRMIFKATTTDACDLVYGNSEVGFPRYDLGLVAARLLTPARQAAQLAPADASPTSHNPLAVLRGGYLFWAALTLVVAGLLIVMAKLLPKPTS